MVNDAADRRISLVARLTAACSAEIANTDPAATIPWPSLPTVAAMTLHLGGVRRWVTKILNTSQKAAEYDFRSLSPGALDAWFEEGRTALVATLRGASSVRPCWVIGGRIGTVEFWQRRMVFENVKHLIDLRAAGGGTWAAVPELDAGSTMSRRLPIAGLNCSSTGPWDGRQLPRARSTPRSRSGCAS